MTTLQFVPENYFHKDKYKKIIKSDSGERLGEIHVSHFKGTLSISSPMYTSIRGNFYRKYPSGSEYEFKQSFDEDVELEDFDIEFEKICRKWEKVIKIIFETIEV